MSLIKCPECGKEISDKALTCPNCGTPINMQCEKPVVFQRKKTSKGMLVKLEFAIDGAYAGFLKNGQSLTMYLFPGTHQVQLPSATGGITSISFDIPEDANEATVLIAPGLLGGWKIEDLIAK